MADTKEKPEEFWAFPLVEAGRAVRSYCTGISHGLVSAPIPNAGTYKQEREGFTYDQENDRYLCDQGNTLKFIGYKKHHGTSKLYMSKRSDCKKCPVRTECIGKSTYKMLTNSLTRPLFDEMHKRMEDDYGKQMMIIRKSTIEPIIGNLVEYLGMRKVNTLGIKLANKCMIMAGIAYNLKKLIKYGSKGFLDTIISLLTSQMRINPITITV